MRWSSSFFTAACYFAMMDGIYPDKIEGGIMSVLTITGIDLVKKKFYLFNINEHGKPTEKLKLTWI